METTIGILIGFFVLAIIEAVHDKHVILWKQTGSKEHSTWWHSMSATYYVIVAGGVSWLALGETWKAVYLAVGLLLVRWFFFDIFLNVLRGLPIDHRGKNLMDKFSHPLIKLVLSAGAITLLFLT